MDVIIVYYQCVNSNNHNTCCKFKAKAKLEPLKVKDQVSRPAAHNYRFRLTNAVMVLLLIVSTFRLEK